MTGHQPELFSQKETPIDPEAQAQKEIYRQRLAEYLKNPEFRTIEGFPIGEDEDILALSDPPYYTACPNPFLPEIIEEWQQERLALREALGLLQDEYHRNPYASDVSEGKNNQIYSAHGYHTKVPHTAIMRYILHYTDPGDIVFDGFCGTGMTGVAAQLCGDRKVVEALGYRVDSEGTIWHDDERISHLGARKTLLNDLSTAATFIAYNYNNTVDADAFERAAKRILLELEQDCGWMYDTWHPAFDAKDRVKGKINYTVWSDVYVCPHCGGEMVFWDVAVNQAEGTIKTTWNCPHCATLLANSPKKNSGVSKVERAWEVHYDQVLDQPTRRTKEVPVLINYSVGKKRFEKQLDANDQEVIRQIEEVEIPYPIPQNAMMLKGMDWGDTWRAGVHAGLTHVHHFYSKRNLYVLARMFHSLKNAPKDLYAFLLFTFDQTVMGMSKWARYVPTHYSQVNQGLSGTLYIGSRFIEATPEYILRTKIRRLKELLATYRASSSRCAISTQSSTGALVPEAIADYIFIDPPFGSNLMYSELNFIHESWLRVLTNNQPEAIISGTQGKGLVEYQELMQICFSEFHRLLKPGGWMTVEFHNTKNSVWNAIQETLQRAGFVIADVRVLDKKQETFKQITTSSAVKQDLIISSYKPNGNLEQRFGLKAGSEDGAWEFVRYHLNKLPVVNRADDIVIVNSERQAYLLFNRMVAFHIQRGVMVPISSPEFYAGLDQRFVQRDGMYFLPDQVAEYDRAVLDSGRPSQLSMFVSDEKTAITWLRQQLDPATNGEPQTRGDLTNKFNQVMHRAKHEKALELIELLEQNFLQDENGKWYVPDHNKASDLDKIRQRALLREFNDYVQSSGRLRQFRTEAVRAGFADCFKRQDYDTLVKVAERLPTDVLREDPDLLMYYDSALLRQE